MGKPSWYDQGATHTATPLVSLSTKRVDRAHHGPDRLRALCWCRSATVWVPQATVLACRTGSCGLDGCDERIIW